MGVDRDRFNIFEARSSSRSEQNNARLMKVILDDIKTFQTIGTHTQEPDTPPEIDGVSWLKISERKSLQMCERNGDKHRTNKVDKQSGLISDLQLKIERIKQEAQDERDAMKARLIEINSEEKELKERIDKETIRYEEIKKKQQSLTSALAEEINRQKNAEAEIEEMKTKVKESERLEQERIEVKRLEQERLEQERLKQERLEQERLKQERLEQERLKQERLEQERLKQERSEQERLEQERLEQERLEQERLEQERLEQEKMIKDPEYEIQIKKRQLAELEATITKEKLRQERLMKKQGLEIYLFACYQGIVIDFVVERYRKACPYATITICDNHTISMEQQNKLRSLDCSIIQYGLENQDLDYEAQSLMYDAVWRENYNNAWVVIAPADTFVDISEESIQCLNDANSNMVGTDNYTMVSKSTKKDLSDINIRNVNTGYKNNCENVIIFNKSMKPTVSYNVESRMITVSSDAVDISRNEKKFNAYSYTYMGLGFYVSRSRQIHAREKRWRDEDHAGCFKYDINEISSEILSLPVTHYLGNPK